MRKMTSLKEEIKMKNADSHIYLYAKGWYKRTDIFEDLRVIYSHRNGVKPSDIRDDDILLLLSTLTFLHINNKNQFYDFIRRCFDLASVGPRWSDLKNYIDLKSIIMGLLSILNLTKIKEDGKVLIELDKPDYTILPKSL